MKTNYKNFLLGILCLFSTGAIAQVSGYFFAQSNGTYTPITGGSVVATATSNAAPGNLASTVWNLPTGTFPFPFIFNGTAYTGCNISCHGYITFGATPPVTTNGSPISATTAYDGAVCAWGRATHGAYSLTGTGTNSTTVYTSEVRVEVLGTAPNRVIVFQWDNWRYSSGTGTTVWLHDFQIKLYETTNVVEIAYGPGVMAGGSLTTGGFNIQVGLRGLTNADFNNRSSFGPFDQSTAGTANNANQAIGVSNGVSTNMPPSGLIYDWYPRCVGAPISPTIAVSTSSLCAGDTVDFSATGQTPYFDVSYQWQVSNTPGGPYTTITGPGTGTMFAPYQTTGVPGTYFYVLKSACPNNTNTVISNQIAVIVHALPVLDVLSSPALNTTVSPIETCFGETYTFTAIGASTYTWHTGPATDSFVVQPLGNPSYTVTGFSAEGCVSTKTIDILVNPLPDISIVTSPTNAICPGQPIVVGAGGTAVTYTWVSPNSSAFLITVTPTVTTTYTVHGTSAENCTNAAIHQVIVHKVAPLIVSASDNTEGICKGEEITLSAGGAASFSWTSPGSFTTGQVVTAFPATNTTYTLTGSDVNGCTTNTTLAVTVLACVGFNENTGTVSPLDVYPNPTNGAFTVELNNGTAKLIEVLDITGKIIVSTSTINDKTDLSLNNLASGVYYLRVQSNNAVEVVKIIKQ